MVDYNLILQKLEQKRKLFAEMESITSAMTLYKVEELAQSMQKRSKIINAIDEIDLQLRAQAEQNELLRRALNNSCDRSPLDGDMARVYDASLAVKAIVNRIIQNEQSVKKHLDFEKSRVLEGIEKLTQSGLSVADRYHKSVQTGRNKVMGMERDKLI